MIIVRDVFTAKPGNASKLAALFKKAMASLDNVRVLTDVFGNYNTVVMELEFETLADYEKQIAEYNSGEFFDKLDSETKAAMKSYTEMWLTGKREVFKVI